MKSFSLLAITALTVSGAAVAQTDTPMSPPQILAQAQTAPAGSSTYPSTSSGTSPSTSSTPSQSTTPTTSQSTTTAPTQSSSPTPATSSTSTSTSTQTQSPAPTVVEQKVDLKTEPGPPADMRAARTEAVNALAWAKSEGCRSDPSPRDCVRHAQDDYRQAMARLGGSAKSSGSVSASGTSQANGARSDRN